MAYRFDHLQRVEFSDTDMAGIAHFSAFFRYMEKCEHAFYRSLGFSVFEQTPGDDSRKVGWPRVHASMDFKAPLRFEEEFTAELWVQQIRRSTIRHGFRFVGVSDGVLRATGQLVIACVRKNAEGRMQAVELPVHVREVLQPTPDEEWQRVFAG